MIDPTYSDTITVGGSNSSYQFNAFPKPSQASRSLSGLLSLQSFILPLTLQTATPGQYDISGSTATLYVTATNNEDFEPVLLAAGVLSDSGAFGGGITDTVTFTVPKGLIPNELGTFGKNRVGNAKFYAILEDGDTYLEFFEGVNVYDTQFGGGGGATPGTLTINNNNLGVVLDTLDTPPGSPATLDAYLVGTSPTGVWLTPSDLSDNLVVWSGAAWIPTAPTEGDFLYDADEDEQKRYNGAAWVTEDAKPFSDADPLIKNSSDSTKLIGFDASAITTGTERTITMPDANVDLGNISTQEQISSGTDNNQTGTSYDLVLGDKNNTTVWMNNGSANELTIPTNASVAFPVGAKINIMMEGAGVTTIAAVSSSVTVNGVTDGSHVINNQYQGATITKRATNTWIVTGDIT